MSTGTKLLTYFSKRLTSIVLVIIILFMATSIAYDCANIYVILEEGMNIRAEVVLTGEEDPQLEKFFTQNCINSDSMLNSSAYEDYIISQYDYKLKLKKVWAWPWSKRAKATVQEIATDILGEPKEDAKFDDEESDEKADEMPIPEWENGEKIVELRKINRRWVIDKITMQRPLKEFE